MGRGQASTTGAGAITMNWCLTNGTFVTDPLYHHFLLNFNSIVKETRKAYLLDFTAGKMWVPISICAYMDRERCSVWVHEKTYHKLELMPNQYIASEEFS